MKLPTLQEQVQHLQAELDKLKERLEGSSRIRKRLSMGQHYWYINGDGVVRKSTETSPPVDESRFQIGNYYHTFEAAELAAYRQRAFWKVADRIAELNAEQGWEPDWGNSDRLKFHIKASFGDGNLTVKPAESWWSCNGPVEWIGSKMTITTVCKEMPDEIKLALTGER